MKRLWYWLFPLMVALAACSSSAGDPNALIEGDAQNVAPQATQPGSPAVEDSATTSSDEGAGETAVDSTGSGNSILGTDPTVVRDRDWTLGAVEPALTVIEYGDFQCPGCAGFAPLLKRLVDAYPNDVRVVFRHFPLNSIHPNAQKSAEAAEAAGAQGKFWEYHDALYERQSDWASLNAEDARRYFIDLAGELGLDTERFAEELDGDLYAAYVSSLEDEAVSLGLPGTPSAIINGQVVPGEGLPRDFAVWDLIVRSEIELKKLTDRQYSAPPAMTIDENSQYLATVEMESGDAFTIELYPKSAPQTVNSFVFLTNEGWFDGVTFHRVIPGFVAQTGDPSGTGRGGPGYMIPNEIDSALSHDSEGIVAMANAGPNTNGSQWYITLGDVSQLDGSYTIFGRVIEGMDVVKAITARDPSRDPSAPAGDRIARITIEEVK